MARRKHWYTKRTPRDVPSHVHDQSFTPEGIWLDGYHSAVQAYLDEVRELLRAEGFDVDGSEWSR